MNSRFQLVLMVMKRRITVLTPSPIEFGLIPPEHWYQPDSIDEGKALKSRIAMQEKGIIYAGSVPYRNMCRFNSGVSAFHHYSRCIFSLFFSFSSVIL